MLGRPTHRIVPPTSAETAVIVEVPHAGLDVPEEHRGVLRVGEASMARDADLFVDELYADAPHEGATILVANVSRYVVDLNRSATDFDADAVAHAPPHAPSPRGLIWRLAGDGRPALRRPLTVGELEQRLHGIYRPYHAALAALIEHKRRTFGHAIVLAAHSMPSAGRGPNHAAEGRLTARADVVPGTRGRTTADPRVIDAVEAHARDHGLSVRHDEPYAGGFTTQHYGRPADHVHVVQIELARRLYMDEQALCKAPAQFDALRHWCRTVVAKLGQTGVR